MIKLVNKYCSKLSPLLVQQQSYYWWYTFFVLVIRGGEAHLGVGVDNFRLQFAPIRMHNLYRKKICITSKFIWLLSENFLTLYIFYYFILEVKIEYHTLLQWNYSLFFKIGNLYWGGALQQLHFLS